MSLLPRSFYEKSAEAVAREFIGKVLCSRVENRITRGIITETEAYLHENDSASHSASGVTPRNRSMFGKAGTGYVYISYGIHYCFNVVTGREGEGQGQAVLIRALQPLKGFRTHASKAGGKGCATPHIRAGECREGFRNYKVHRFALAFFSES